MAEQFNVDHVVIYGSINMVVLLNTPYQTKNIKKKDDLNKKQKPKLEEKILSKKIDKIINKKDTSFNKI